MEKILIPLGAEMPSTDTLTFGIYLARLTRSNITGVFLENRPAFETPVLIDRYDGAYLEWETDEQSREWQEMMQRIGLHMQQFKEFFDNHGVACNTQRDSGAPVKEMMIETRYADLLLVDAETSFREEWEKLPTDFVEDMLIKAECPVVIAGGAFEGIDEIVFAWDGRAAAAYAIKSFTHLFPSLSDKKITVVYVDDGGQALTTGRHLLQTWLEHHYKDIHWQRLTGPIDTALFSSLINKRKAFMVFGAYGRSFLSRFFRGSHVEKVVKSITQPIFIAHQ